VGRSEAFRRRFLALAQIRPGLSLRRLLHEVLGDIDGEDAKFAAANLLDDSDDDLSYWLHKQFENAFFSRQETEFGGGYSLIPRSNNTLRRFLYDLAMFDSGRKKSAARVLVNLENERLEMGRPVDEPPHPNWTAEIASADPWQLVAL
ncbi:MAG: hypothetical protein ACREM1_03050, partial [Longimicrobiales bacterium]